MIRLVEKEDLRSLLRQCKFTDKQIQDCINGLLTHTHNASKRIFHEILQEPISDMEVRLAQSSEKDYRKFGGFFVAESKLDHLVFSFYDPLFMKYSDPNHPEFILTVYHEMVHAMDCAELIRCEEIYKKLNSIIYEHYADAFNRTTKNMYEPVLLTLRLLGHYRAEGIATFCSSIITNSKLKFSLPEYTAHLGLFKKITTLFFIYPQDSSISPKIFLAAYNASASILYQILDVCNLVPKTILHKISDNYTTGDYQLTDEELKTLLDACRKLTLADYIQALITYDVSGETLTDLNALLNFCGRLQRDIDEENKASFIQLLENKSQLNLETFQTTLQDISSYAIIPQDKIDEMLNNIQHIHPDLRGKVAQLYDIYKGVDDPVKKDLCHWVFTYIIDREDIIHDDLPVYGIVDDLTMLDIALDILNKS